MEACKTSCFDCGHIRFWMGYKTGIGKSPTRLEKMRRDQITCVVCGSTNAKTELDRESEIGLDFNEMDDHLITVLAGLLGGRHA